jgi:hypothetical protein
MTEMKRLCQDDPSAFGHPAAFERLGYFYGQLLGVDDFRTEQRYFMEKRKLHNRCLHGWGVVCGLDVHPCPPPPDCEPKTDGKRREIEEKLAELDREIARCREQLEAAERYGDGAAAEKHREACREKEAEHERCERERDALPPCEPPKRRPEGAVVVGSGMALDCHGNELIVGHALIADLWASLDHEERRRIDPEGCNELYLSICHCEQPTHPTRPMLPEACGAVSDCSYGRIRDAVKLRVSLSPPDEDTRCDTCCEPCRIDCVYLARILWHPRRPLEPGDIDTTVRRPLSRHVPAVISGVSWVHGATYGYQDARKILGTEQADGTRSSGLEIAFSRDVHSASFAPAVLEVRRYQGGRGLRGVISQIEGRYSGGLEAPFTRSVNWQDESGETLNPGDRVHIHLRASFVLDACCRPVDGEHVGGRVPQLPGFAERFAPCAAPSPDFCLCPPGGRGPWTSGNGVSGGDFESWFFIE